MYFDTYFKYLYFNYFAKSQPKRRTVFEQNTLLARKIH